jgi:predicted AAA+ superfamily ATPase
LKRKLINQLLEWKELTRKQPIFLTGGKGVGKSYLVLDYAKTFYHSYIYINYELNVNSLNHLDAKSISVNAILDYILQLDSPEPVLLILDEVSFFAEFKNLITVLTNTRQIHIITISSIKLVGIWEEYFKLTLYPLDFEEFLLAINKEWYIGVIREHFNTNLVIPDIVHSELLNLCDSYLRIGGMPMAVNEYVSTGTELNIAQIHKLILKGYLSEIYFDNQEAGSIRVSQIIKTLPLQLGKANKKFQYSLIRKGATKNLYLDALEYVKETYYAMDCHRIDGFDEEFLHFKLYFFDPGILHSLAIDSKLKASKHFRKGLLENFIALHLCVKGYPLNFWESDSQSKVEFVISRKSKFVPIEVRVDNNTRSKNLSMFRAKYSSTSEAIKISTKNFSYENHIKYVPLYAVFCI